MWFRLELSKSFDYGISLFKVGLRKEYFFTEDARPRRQQPGRGADRL
jgi:hypothetical protein